MRRKISTACLLFAWLCANGAIWDVMQVFAWTKMFTGYAQNMAVAAALKETFDPNKPCELCTTVAKAKEQEQKQLPPQIERGADKLVLATHANTPVVFHRPAHDWPGLSHEAGMSRTDPVPLPPPRV